jgi:hypothetical protein
VWEFPPLRAMRLAHNTLRSYTSGRNAFLRWWYADPSAPTFDPTTLDVGTVARFIEDCFDADVGYASVNQARCWLACIDASGQMVVRHREITERMAGYENADKLVKRHMATWPITWARLWAVRGKLTATTWSLCVLAHAFLLRWEDACQVARCPSRAVVQTRQGGYRLCLRHDKRRPFGGPGGRAITVVFPARLFRHQLGVQVDDALQMLRRHRVQPSSSTINHQLRQALGHHARFHGNRHGRCSDLRADAERDVDIQAWGRWASRRAMEFYCHRVSARDRRPQ